MRRDRAFFDGSRLYRQAAEGAPRLIEALVAAERQAPPPLAHLVPSGRRLVEGPRGLDALVSDQKHVVTNLAAGISAYHALPILAEATERAYRGREEGRVEGLGPALKLTHAFTFPNVFATTGRPSSSIADLARLVHACFVLDVLLTVRMHAELAPAESLFVDSNGFEPEPAFNAISDEFRRAFEAKGRVARMAETAASLLQVDAIAEVASVLGGEDPRDLPVLARTVLGQISNRNRAFWGGLLARLSFLISACSTRNQVSAAGTGIAILGSAGYAFSNSDRIDRAHAQQMFQEAFWTQAWLAKQPLDVMRHLVVRRPVQRISAESELFVTTVGACADSVTTWIEDAIFGESWVDGAALAPFTFQTLISAPFEIEACEAFRRHGFDAGRVTENGTWSVGDRRRDLAKELGEPPPGEIDVLAVHPRGYVIVAECKVLALPFEAARLRNIASKLSPDDSEGFRSKLRRKVGWVSRLGRRLVPNFDGAMGAIVLDRVLPGAIADSNEIVADLATLEGAIARLVARHE